MVCQTCGSTLTPVPTSIQPLVTKTSPVAKVVLVGYHRPLFISGKRVQLLVDGIERVGVWQASPSAYVSASYQQPSVGQKRKTGAENICSHMCKRRVRVCRWIPEVRIISIGEGRPPYDLACGQDSSVDGFERPGRPS